MAGGVFSSAKLNGMTIRESADDGSDFTNPDADYRRLFLGEDGQLHVKDSAGTVTGIGGAIADILDLDTAETDDTLVLAPDGAGGVEFRAEAAGGGIDSGASFPGSPTAGDLFHRTDLTPALWRYDGTRWLCTCQHEASLGQVNSITATNGVSGRFALPAAGLDLYIDEFISTLFVVTTNNGSNYWTTNIVPVLADNSSDAAYYSANTSALAADTWVELTGGAGQIVDVSAYKVLRWSLQKTSSGGALSGTALLKYRFIAT